MKNQTFVEIFFFTRYVKRGNIFTKNNIFDAKSIHLLTKDLRPSFVSIPIYFTALREPSFSIPEREKERMRRMPGRVYEEKKITL